MEATDEQLKMTVQRHWIAAAKGAALGHTEVCSAKWVNEKNRLRILTNDSDSTDVEVIGDICHSAVCQIVYM